MIWNTFAQEAAETQEPETPSAQAPIAAYVYEPIRKGDQFIRMGLQLGIPLFNTSPEKSAIYSKIYPGTDALSIDKTISDLVSANAALSLVLKNYYIKKAQGRLIFVHRDADIPCGNPNISAASAAFARIAEETVDAVRKTELPGVQTLLVKLEGFEDEVFADWLCNQIASPVLSRSPGRWVKAGQRSFFGK